MEIYYILALILTETFIHFTVFSTKLSHYHPLPLKTFTSNSPQLRNHSDLHLQRGIFLVRHIKLLL
jgi:hypothetical protein